MTTENRTDPDYVIKAIQSNSNKRIKNKRIGLDRKKPEMLKVMSVLFFCYVLQVIL